MVQQRPPNLKFGAEAISAAGGGVRLFAGSGQGNWLAYPYGLGTAFGVDGRNRIYQFHIGGRCGPKP